jgi:hypothetical protein
MKPRNALAWIFALVSVLLLALSCSSHPESTDGSETHFLTNCDATCASGLQCVCGVCTKPCADDSVCTTLGASCTPLAARVAERRCDATAGAAVCDAGCLETSDCAALGADFVCTNGYCRVEAEVPIAPANQCDHSDLAPADLLVLGDSLIQLSTFTKELEAKAIAAGTLAADAHFRDSASYLTSFLAKQQNSLSIWNEYDTARQQGRPRVIVMDGGATDVLNNQCADNLTTSCAAAQAAVAGAEALFRRFADDGVEHVVYFFYADPVNVPDLKAGIDLLRPLIENACGRSPVACHWLDLRPTFDGHPEYAAADGIVFSDSGAAAAAGAVWDLMQQRCVAQ